MHKTEDFYSLWRSCHLNPKSNNNISKIQQILRFMNKQRSISNEELRKNLEMLEREYGISMQIKY